ncbi:hypothetical protein [Halarsenatibacter silvermanii]|uniref:Uncharacterized protein n=1 Tax=Halarsenatibacter silvermanii TaxID=321763 RepID=A0A1G9M2H7_9FIRM|nr:hypothetical protein [Halarsenatibacter silvermanii]SDL68354.1 hypothetical protein SAMN04488692_10784 [Halarsenatibacter silvermanii]
MAPEDIENINELLKLLKEHGRNEYEQGNTRDLRKYAEEKGIKVDTDESK